MLNRLTLLCVVLFFGCFVGADKSAAQALDKFTCTADQTTGFKWDGKKWNSAAFPVKAEKIAVEEVAPFKSSIDDRMFNYVVKKAGYSSSVYDCTRHDIKEQRGTRITCGGLGYGFALDFKSLRFQEYHGLGYIGGFDRTDDYTSITIGRCTRDQ